MQAYQSVGASRYRSVPQVAAAACSGAATRNPIPSFAVTIKPTFHGLKEAAMPSAAPSKADKIEHPQSHYTTPDELIDDPALSLDEKIKALKIWEQDARQMLTASGEGMPGSEEGIDPSNHNMLGQVERARDKLQRHRSG
jgi:hypothetical protein